MGAVLKLIKQIFIFLILCCSASPILAHSGGLNKQGCHAGSQPHHCHGSSKPKTDMTKGDNILIGTVTKVRDGDTIEINGIAVRISALNCPENSTQLGKKATKLAKRFQGSSASCELTGAKTYDRLVGYCSVAGSDFALFMMQNSACKIWEKYDTWDRY